jgi:hypothetical protein
LSQQEFETYLTLLCKLLRVESTQREQVAQELRAHMEDRLDELLARGIPRQQAIQMVLEEFGDAAGLAAQLASISWNRKQRWYMKVSAFGVAGLAAAGLLALALWPESGRVPATPQAVAQQPAKDKPQAKAETLEAKLARRARVEFMEMPLKDVLSYFADTYDIQVYVSRRALENEAIPTDAPVTLTLKDVRLETALELALDQVSPSLAYQERDNVLIISTLAELEGATEVRVYNCRDLLAMTSPQPGMGGLFGPGGMGMPGIGPPTGGFSAPDAGGGIAPSGGDPPGGTDAGGIGPPSAPIPRPSPGEGASMGAWKERAILAQVVGGGSGRRKASDGGAGDGRAAPGGMMPGGMVPGVAMPGGMMADGMMPDGTPTRLRRSPETDHERRAERLMNLITTAVDPGSWHSWQQSGGFGTISEYEGLIVVNHSARTHKKIENVLKMLRESAGLPPQPLLGGPGGLGGGVGDAGGITGSFDGGLGAARGALPAGSLPGGASGEGTSAPPRAR